MRWKRAVGMSVISTETAESIGTVDGFVVDAAASTLTGIVVAGEIIAWSTSEGIGEDAVTVSGEQPTRAPEGELEAAAASGAADPLGKMVLTEAGVDRGHVSDLVFDPSSGDIRRLVLGDDEVDGSRLLGVGSYAVVISSPDSGDASSGVDLSAMTKTELYELAKERDLDGRSSMTKRELVDALR